METTEELTRRVDDLTVRVMELEHRLASAPNPAPPAVPSPAGAPSGTDRFWALDALKERLGEDDPDGAVLFTGVVPLPTGERYEWQEGHPSAALLDRDWSGAAPNLVALAHPVRLALLRQVLHGGGTTAELQATDGLGTSGQLYHHLRQLTSAGWIRGTARGHYAVPGERVVPLLAVLAGADR